MNSLMIGPAPSLRGRVELPASKSISNRALIINALSGGSELPENLSDSDDTQVMLRALRTLSQQGSLQISLRQDGKDTLHVEDDRAGEPIDIGAAGTAMRFLTAYLSVAEGEHTITGTERMRHRPIGILVDALRELGADISYEGEEGFPPLRIKGQANLDGGSLTVAGNVSSQYVSALLMIAPTLRRGLRLTLTGNIASKPYLDMTMSMMRDFGAKVEWEEGNVISVQPHPYHPRPYRIESDWSAASYWYEMVALSHDESAEVHLIGLRHDSIQGDSRVSKMFSELGVETQYSEEPDGTGIVCLRKGRNVTSHFSEDFTHQPDLAQTLAATCAMLGISFQLSGLQSLRIKETDRIAALQKELGKLVQLEVEGDELKWDGIVAKQKAELHDGSLAFDTYEDHRMAMALAPLCLRTDTTIRINNPQVVSKSYPQFWSDLGKIGFKICR